MKAIPMIGKRFGRLVVVARVSTKYGAVIWECKCDCGGNKITSGASLRKGATSSCGCIRKDSSPQKHGGCKNNPREYGIWCGIKQRCFNHHQRAYKNYGGRGISMCEEWRNDFQKFLDDMGECPPGYSIERIDVNGNYCQSNCKWINKNQQNDNYRKTVWIKRPDGTKSTLKQVAFERGIKYSTLARAVRDGKDALVHVPRKSPT